MALGGLLFIRYSWQCGGGFDKKVEILKLQKVCLNRTMRKNKPTLERRWLWRQNSNTHGSNTTAGPASCLVFSSREPQLRRRLKKQREIQYLHRLSKIMVMTMAHHEHEGVCTWRADSVLSRCVRACVRACVCVCVCVSEPLKSASHWRSERRAEQQRRPHSAHLHHQAEPLPLPSMKRIISFYLFIVLSRRDKNGTTSHFFFCARLSAFSIGGIISNRTA